MKRTLVSDAVRAQLRSLVARPAPPPLHYPPLLVRPTCTDCGKQHLASFLCPERAWNLMQQQQGKTP